MTADDLGAIVVIVVLATSSWMFFDAPTHGLSRAWALGGIALWIVAFPWYLAQRAKAQRAPVQPPSTPPAVPPGWHDDPWKKARYRYWDGAQWTAHTSEGKEAHQ